VSDCRISGTLDHWNRGTFLLHNLGIDSQFVGLTSSLIRNLWNQIAAKRQGCPWILATSTRRNGRRRNAGPRFFRSCPSGLRASKSATRWRRSGRSDDVVSLVEAISRERSNQCAGAASSWPPLRDAALSAEVLAIVATHFQEFYATRRRPTLTRFWTEVAADCQRRELPVPSIRRLRRWLDRQDEADLLRRREGKGKSEPVFLATPDRWKRLRRWRSCRWITPRLT